MSASDTHTHTHTHTYTVVNPTRAKKLRRPLAPVHHLIVVEGVLGHAHEGRTRHRHEETRDVVHPRRFHHSLHLRALQVRLLVFIRGCQVRAQAALLVLDQHRARARWHRRVLHDITAPSPA